MKLKNKEDIPQFNGEDQRYPREKWGVLLFAGTIQLTELKIKLFVVVTITERRVVELNLCNLLEETLNCITEVVCHSGKV